jgi:hypothetical protein
MRARGLGFGIVILVVPALSLVACSGGASGGGIQDPGHDAGAIRDGSNQSDSGGRDAASSQDGDVHPVDSGPQADGAAGDDCVGKACGTACACPPGMACADAWCDAHEACVAVAPLCATGDAAAD